MWPSKTAEMDASCVETIADPEQSIAHVIECVEQKDSKGLNTYILEHKLKEESILWDLILKIGECIKFEVKEKHPEFFNACNCCLLYLVGVGNPKENLLALLQQMDTFEMDDIKFKYFLKYLELVLLRVPTKLFHSLDIALETISAHIEVLPLPENLQLEGKEIQLFHLDDKVIRLNDILGSYLDFLSPLVAHALLFNQDLPKGKANEALVLKKHLVQLFDHPLCYLILTFEHDTHRNKCESRISAEKAFNLLVKVETDFHQFLKNIVPAVRPKTDKDFVKGSGVTYKGSNNKEETDKSSECTIDDVVETWDFKLNVSALAKACISYLIHTEFLGIDKHPCVYRHEYILEFHLDSIFVLLSNTNYAVNFKGLLLCKSLTDLVNKSSIAADSLDNPGYFDVLNGLINIMIKCPVRDHRTLGTSLFPAFIARFDAFGRYKIYQNILSSCTHSGLKGYLITLLKNDVYQSLQLFKLNPEKDNMFSSYKNKSLLYKCFFDISLHRLMKLALSLPEKEESDMLENSDHIISALNFLRFLVLADPPSCNITGVWNYMDFVEKDFINPLRLGLDISQAHYKLERENIAQGKITRDKDPKFSVAVEGGILPEADKEQKLDLLAKALSTHELMTSLVCRLCELIQQQLSQPSQT